MPWFKVWDGLKNKTCRYLLHRYLGQFLEEKLNLEQLNVELYNGKATVKNVSLNVDALNELFEAQGWSVEVTRGTIGLITLTVPWNALMTNNSYIEISDLIICLRPVQRQNNGTSMLESMWSSVSSSLQLAQECMNQTDDYGNIEQKGQKESIDGLEKFAETIDNVLNRIRAKCTNVILKLEYLPKDYLHGIAVLIKIDAFNYQNNADNEKREEKISGCKSEESTIENEDVFYNNVNMLSTFATHNISLNDVCVYTEEFKVSNSNIDSAMSNLWELTGNKYSSETLTEDSKGKSDNIDDKNSSEKSFEVKSESIPIPILSLKGKQRIILKMKQSEDIEGPKVILDIELGEICLIVTPRQIQLLSQFCELFSYNENTSVPCKNEENVSCLVTNIESSNSRIKNYTSTMTGGLENRSIWGEIHDNEHIKQTESFGKQLDAKSEYQFCESISSSMSSSSTVTSSTRFQRKIPNIEICGDISKFNVKIAVVMAIILQEDILVEQNINMCNSPLNEKSQRDMLDIAGQCFCIFNSKINKNNLGISKNMCNKNHISLQIYPIIVNGMQHRNKNVLLLNMCTTATTLDLQEILEDIPSPLIYFTNDENCFNTRPQLTINMKSTAPFNSQCSNKRIIPPRTDFEIFLEKCVVELDISIYDRLSAIIGLSPFKKYHQTRDQETRKTSKEESLHSYPNAKFSSETIEIKLRFPIVDVRPINDPDRVPWWKQNIRPDYLLLCLKEIHSTIGLNNFEIRANEVDVFYCECSMTKTHLLKVTGACDSTSLMDPIFEYPTIVIKTPIAVDFRDCEKCNTECCNIDCCCLPFSAKRVCRQSDTIHSKYDVPEESETFVLPGETAEIRKFCDTTFKLSKLNIKIDLPSVKLQFESKQMYEVIYNRLNCDLFMWEPCSPIFQNSLENQTEFLIEQNTETRSLETLYESTTSTFYSFERTEDNEHMEYGASCQLPAFGLYSSSENLEHNKFTKEKTNSIPENNKGGKFIKKSSSKKRSLCSLEVTIGKGSLTFFVRTRDVENQILPMELGKFIIRVNNLYIFFVSGLKSNKNLEYLCLNLNDLEVFHCGIIPVGSPISLNMSPDLPPYMKSTFYKTPSCLTKGKAEGCIRRELLSVVIEINKMPEKRIKRLKITMGLQKTTLRHNPALFSQTWLCQLLDFLEIKDYPVSGYEPYGIISEMQLHLWDCAIDYRPKNFPFRSVLEIGAFNISSNIISSVIGCTLRFVAEECVLSIAPFDINIAYPDCEITAIPSSNLVPVLDIGLLDISLRLSDKSTERCPKLDFRTVIQGVHLRTCSDSGSALAQLISYITSDGDILKSRDNKSSTSSIHSSIHAEDEMRDRGVKEYLSADISDEQQEHVNKLMAEAVQEPLSSLEKSCVVSNESASDDGIEVYYFPDECHNSSSNDLPELLENQKDQEIQILPSGYSQDPDEFNDLLSFEENVMHNSYFVNTDTTIEALPQIKEDLGDISAINKHCNESSSNNYDDYCFIAEEEKSFMTNFGIKNVNISDDPLRIVDNHFLVPICKPDLLKSPENFPMAENRYTLCEMTFTWYLYGGNDFPLNDGAANQPTYKAPCTSNKGCKSNMSKAYKHGVSYSKDTESLLFGKKPKEKLTWKTIGGVNRHHEVLVEIQLSKVRFSHEVYSDYTTHASRQVLVITELEIRDRLQSSDINKFLYHPKSNNLPNTSNQNMIVIKALHVRPSPKINFSQECSLRISLLPLRFHIDQDTLLFLVDFFTNLGDYCKNEAIQSGIDSKNSRNVSFREIQDPVMKVDTVPEAVHDLYARRLFSENLDILMKDQKQSESKSVGMNTRDENCVIYFREIVFSPEVLIRLDYHGRRVELSRGPVTGLLMGLGQLQCSEIRLRKIVYKRGLLGFEKLITYLCKEWLRDIKKNQLPNILSGVGPTYAFIQLFQGIYDLIWLPIEQFQKDGRIIRGLQLGAQSFTARTALAALEITSRIIQLLQFTAETAFDMVSTGPTVARQRISHMGKRKRQHRPKDIREGVTNAYIIMKEGFNDSAHKFIETAVAEHDQKGYTGAVGAVMRQIPQLVVCPAVLATQATTNILGGAKSSLVPEAKLEARDKWKDDTD